MPLPRPEDLAQEVLASPPKAAIFLTVTVNAGSEAFVRDSLARVAGWTRAVAFRVPEAQLTCVTAIGAEVWERMYDAPRPGHLHPFVPVVGAHHVAVSTPGDILFHIRSSRADACFELCRQLLRGLAGGVQPVDEVHGFRYWDERDLLGFVDGTESPRSIPVAAAVALVGDDDPDYAGGSYVVAQKYLHDLAAWEQLSVTEQEQVVGREKLSDIELLEPVKPSNSHVAVTTITDPDGTARQIVRSNMPFGNAAAGEFGTYFLAYAADPAVIERMLHRMFVGEPLGNTDRILEFSTPVTGGLFFAPPAGWYGSTRRPSREAAFVKHPSGTKSATSPTVAARSPGPDARAVGPGAAAGAQSLHIGSLNRSDTS